MPASETTDLRRLRHLAGREPDPIQGGQLNPAQKVRVACLRTRRMLLYRIADPGAGFKFDAPSHAAIHGAPEAVAHDVVRNAKGLRPGGFGLVLIRAIADDLIYNERQTEVVFVKYLDEPCGGRDQAADSRRRDDANTAALRAT